MALFDALLSLKSTASCKGLAMLAIVDVSMHPRASGQVIMLILGSAHSNRAFHKHRPAVPLR
jgi:hypothetical protein